MFSYNINVSGSIVHKVLILFVVIAHTQRTLSLNEYYM